MSLFMSFKQSLESKYWPLQRQCVVKMKQISFLYENIFLTPPKTAIELTKIISNWNSIKSNNICMFVTKLQYWYSFIDLCRFKSHFYFSLAYFSFSVYQVNETIQTLTHKSDFDIFYCSRFSKNT